MGETVGENWPSKIRRLVTKKNVARVITGAVVTTGAVIAGQHVDKPSVPAEGLTDANPPKVLPVSEVDLPQIQAEQELGQNPVITEQKPIEPKAEEKATEAPKADLMAQVEQSRKVVEGLLKKLYPDENPLRPTVTSQEKRYLQQLLDEAWKKDPTGKAAVEAMDKYVGALESELAQRNEKNKQSIIDYYKKLGYSDEKARAEAERISKVVEIVNTVTSK